MIKDWPNHLIILHRVSRKKKHNTLDYWNEEVLQHLNGVEVRQGIFP